MHPPQTSIPPFRADGEFRHTSWHMDCIYPLRGVSRADSELQVHFRDAAGELEFTSAAEIAGPAELGWTYLQLDDTSLAYLNDPTQRAQLTAAGADGEH